MSVHLTEEGVAVVELEPEFSATDLLHLTQSTSKGSNESTLFRKIYGSYNQKKIPVRFVSDTDKLIINNWAKNKTELFLYDSYLYASKLSQVSCDPEANKVINGDFPINTTGWTLNGDGAISSVSGELQVTFGTISTSAQQNVTLVIGRPYKLTWTAREVTTTTGVMRLIGAADAAIQVDSTSNVDFEYVFTALSTILNIFCRLDSAGSVYFDNIILTEYCIPGIIYSNLLSYPENFDHAVWIKSGNVAIIENQAIAPDGSLSMDLYNISAAVNRTINQSITGDPANKTFTFSIYIQAVVDTVISPIFLRNGFGTFAFPNENIAVADGISRIDFTYTYDATAGTTFGFQLYDISGGIGDRFYIWGAQLTETAELQDYIPQSAESVVLTNKASPINKIAFPYIDKWDGTLELEVL